MKRGVSINDEEDNQRGISQVAAKNAVMQTAFSRPILPIPIFGVPGVFFYMLDKKGMMPKNKVVDVVLQLGVLTVALWVALPLSVALFPSNGSLSVSEVEEEFRDLKLSTGEQVKTFTFNKGL